MTGLLNSKSSKLKKHFILATIYLVVYLGHMWHFVHSIVCVRSNFIFLQISFFGGVGLELPEIEEVAQKKRGMHLYRSVCSIPKYPRLRVRRELRNFR